MNNKKWAMALLTTTTLAMAGTTSLAQKTITREVNQEVPSQQGAFIRIIAGARKVNIKTWDQPKVKITMEIVYDSSAPKRTDAEWFTELGLNVKPFNNRVDIIKSDISYDVERKTTSYFPIRKVDGKFLDEVVVQGYGTRAKSPVKTKSEQLRTIEVQKKQAPAPQTVTVSGFLRPTIRVMNITIPAGCKLDVTTRYSDVVISTDVEEAKLKITNGVLDAQNIKDLKLEGNYCTANLGNIEKAAIEFNNGTFRAIDIKDLDIDSKSSAIDYEKGSYAYIRSQNDSYTIDVIDKVDARKVYGDIKIEQLNNSFELEGNNVDIKFRNIAPSVSLIKIDDRYADLRLPVKDLKNFFVDFTGHYSTVFAPFQKQVTKEDSAALEEVVVVGNYKPSNKVEVREGFKTSNESTTIGSKSFKESATTSIEKKNQEVVVVGMPKADPLRSIYGNRGSAPRHFTGSAGDTTGTHTRITLTCHSCTVDFK